MNESIEREIESIPIIIDTKVSLHCRCCCIALKLPMPLRANGEK